MSTETRRLPSLTGLRYLAAVLVVLHHLLPLVAAGTFLATLSEHGYIGVTFFFVLSGFVLAWTSPGYNGTVNFYRRRFARVYPLHAATWLAAVGLSAATGGTKSAIGSALALVLLQAWFPTQGIYFGGNAVSWSLSCEAFFYAIFPLLAWRFRMAMRGSWLLPAVAVVVAGEITVSATNPSSYWFVHINPLYRALEFVLGILLAAAVREGRFRTKIPVAVPMAIAAVAYVALSAFGRHLPIGVVNASAIPFIVAILICAASADLDDRTNLWSTKTLVRLGTWSYALYLTHYMIVRRATHLSAYTDGHILLGIIAAVFGVIGLTLVAAAAYHFVEHPMEARLRPARPRLSEPTNEPSDSIAV